MSFIVGAFCCIFLCQNCYAKLCLENVDTNDLIVHKEWNEQFFNKAIVESFAKTMWAMGMALCVSPHKSRK